MNKADKIGFVRELSKSIGDKIIQEIASGNIPEEWEGIELRWLIADNTTSAFYHSKNNPNNRKRLREYKNTVIANNL